MADAILPTNPRFINLTGHVYGRLTVVSYAGKRGVQGSRVWNCRCECGTELVCYASNLRTGDTRSCGCWQQENLPNIRLKHGGCRKVGRLPEHNVFVLARQRCINPKLKSYRHYGGRGIEFRFTSFEHFMDAVGPRPSPRHSLDRIDNEGHYEPGNVRWATTEQQANNKRNSVWVSYGGRSLTVAELATETGVPRFTLRRRLSCGWCVECAVSLPPRSDGGLRAKGQISCPHRRTAEGVSQPGS